MSLFPPSLPLSLSLSLSSLLFSFLQSAFTIDRNKLEQDLDTLAAQWRIQQAQETLEKERRKQALVERTALEEKRKEEERDEKEKSRKVAIAAEVARKEQETKAGKESVHAWLQQNRPDLIVEAEAEGQEAATEEGEELSKSRQMRRSGDCG